MRKTPLYTFFFVITLVSILTLLQIIVSNSIATGGAVVGQIRTEIAQVKKENGILREEIYQDASLTHVASAAAQMGIVEKSDELVLTAPLPLALK